MKIAILVLVLIYLLGCGDSSTRLVTSKVVKITTPDGVEIRDGEVSQVLANIESKDRFVSYLQRHNIYYRLDDRFPNEVSWIPESDEHGKEVMRAAFGIPLDQIQKLFSDEKEYDEYVSILNRHEINYHTQSFEEQFLVIWTPESESVSKRIDDEVRK